MGKIVINAQICQIDQSTSNEADVLANPLKARAILAFVGAEFSDGTPATEDTCKKLVDSVDFSRYNPPLLVDHVWLADSVKGKMTAIELTDDGQIIARFEVTDRETAEKIRGGEWNSISVTFDADSFEIQECSIVAVPAIKGAKIEEENANNNSNSIDNSNSEDLPGIDDMPEEDTDPELELVDSVPENAEELTEKCDKSAEKTCKNAEFERVLVENARMKKEISSLRQQMKEEKLSRVVRDLVAGFVQNGMTPPTVDGEEREFLLKLAKIDENLLKTYGKIKENCAKNYGFGGPRISVPDYGQSREEMRDFLERAEKFDKERINRRW